MGGTLSLTHARAHEASYRLYLSLALQPATRNLVPAEVAKRRAMLVGVEEELRSIFSELGHADPETAALVLRVTVDGLIQYLLVAGDGFPIDEAVSRACPRTACPRPPSGGGTNALHSDFHQCRSRPSRPPVGCRESRT